MANKAANGRLASVVRSTNERQACWGVNFAFPARACEVLGVGLSALLASARSMNDSAAAAADPPPYQPWSCGPPSEKENQIGNHLLDNRPPTFRRSRVGKLKILEGAHERTHCCTPTCVSGKAWPASFLLSLLPPRVGRRERETPIESLEWLESRQR